MDKKEKEEVITEMKNALIERDNPLPEIKKDEPKELIPLSVQDEMTKLIPFAGTIDITDKQRDILFAPVREEDVEIRPDGLVYLPWMEYVSRLRDAFGISWAIIPKDMPKFEGNHIFWSFYLMIQGKLAGFAIGEQQYHPSNATMTYGDAIEGAKSNALMRLCKGLGISLELWKPSFVRGWKEKYAEEYDDRGRKKWKKKNGKQGDITPESSPVENHGPEPELFTPKDASAFYETVHTEMVRMEKEKVSRTEFQKYWAKNLPEISKLPADMKKALVEYKIDLLKELK
jgi:hypothetical protein